MPIAGPPRLIELGGHHLKHDDVVVRCPTLLRPKPLSRTAREGRQPTELLGKLRSHIRLLGAGKSSALVIGKGQEDLDQVLRHHGVYGVGEAWREELPLSSNDSATLQVIGDAKESRDGVSYLLPASHRRLDRVGEVSVLIAQNA